MKRTLLTTTLLLMSTLALWAQEGKPAREAPSGYKAYFTDWSVPNRSCRYEIRVGRIPQDVYGDTEVVFPGGGSAWNNYYAARYEAGRRHAYTSPAITLSVALHPHFELSLTGLVTSVDKALYDKVSGLEVGGLHKANYWLNPALRINIFNTRYIRQYVGFGVDMSLQRDGGESSLVGGVALKLGMTAGARIFCFGDISISSELAAISAGVGYRF